MQTTKRMYAHNSKFSQLVIFRNGNNFSCAYCKLGAKNAPMSPQQIVDHVYEHIKAKHRVNKFDLERLLKDTKQLRKAEAARCTTSSAPPPPPPSPV